MKYLIMTILCLVIFSCKKDMNDDMGNGDGNHTDSSKIDLNEGLIAYWNFDDENALNQIDSENYHASAVGSYEYVESRFNKSIFLEGIGDGYSGGGYVELPRIDFESMDEFNISMWVNNINWSYPHGDWYIFWGDDSKQWLGISNSILRPGNLIDRYIQFGVGIDVVENGVNYNVQSISSDNSSNYLMNSWHHFMINYKNGTMFAYIDGVIIGQLEQEVRIWGEKGAIGAHWWYEGSGKSARFIGLVDEVRIYEKSLTNGEMEELYKLFDE